MTDKYQDALRVTNTLLDSHLSEVATESIAVLGENVKILKLQVERPPSQKLAEKDNSPKTFEKRIIFYDDIQEETYKKLCRKEFRQTAAAQAPLRCKYITNDIPFLKIGPIKVEESSIDPYIVTFHDVLYDSEIEYIIGRSKPTVKLWK